MRHHLEAERLQLADQVLRRILVSRVALSRPAVPVACAPIDVHCKARVGDLVEPVVHDSSVQQAAGVGPALVHASNRGANRAQRLHRYAPTALGAVVHCVQSRILTMRHSYDPVARIALVPFMHHPGHPRLVRLADRPVVAPLGAHHQYHRVYPRWRENLQTHTPSCRDIHHGRVLHETRRGIDDEIGHEDRHPRLGAQLDLLEHTRLQNLWCHAQAGGAGLGLLLSEAAAERR